MKQDNNFKSCIYRILFKWTLVRVSKELAFPFIIRYHTLAFVERNDLTWDTVKFTKQQGGTLLKEALENQQNKILILGTSLMVQWLRLHAPNAGVLGLLPGQGTGSYIPQLAVLHASNKDSACLN